MPEFSNAMQAEEFSDFLIDHLDWVFEDDLPTHDKLFDAWLPSVSGGLWKEEGKPIAGLGAMPAKAVGGSITVDKFIPGDSKTFTTKTWGLAVLFEYELKRHDQYDLFDDVAREMAKSAVDRCNIMATTLFNNFFSTADSAYTIYNGEALGSTSHNLLGGGTLSNRASSNPALTYTALQTGRTDFMKMQNERGLYIRLKPEVLVVPPDTEYYAQTLIKSSLRPGTANNDTNVLPKWRVFGEDPYHTSTTAWFLCASKAVLKRRSVRFRTIDKPFTRSDYEAATMNTVFTCYQANRMETLHYQGLYGSDGTGS